MFLSRAPHPDCSRRTGCRPAWLTPPPVVNVCMIGCKLLSIKLSARSPKCKHKPHWSGRESAAVSSLRTCASRCVWSSEPKPVYAQPGQPDVDLPVSPADAPVPSAAHDDSILRYACPDARLCGCVSLLDASVVSISQEKLLSQSNTVL